MGLFDRFRPDGEQLRTSQDKELIRVFGLDELVSVVSVTPATAMRVPAFSACVNLIANTLAALPLHVYSGAGDDRKRLGGAIGKLLRDAPNPGLTSFNWRQQLLLSACVHGRGLSFIERDGAKIVGIYPIDPLTASIERKAGRMIYTVTERNATRTYDAEEIIDIPFALKADGVSHYRPFELAREIIALSIGTMEYGSKIFGNGGVPPFVFTGNFQSANALQAASDDIGKAIRKQVSDPSRAVVTVPMEAKLEKLGFPPEAMHLHDIQQHCAVEIARIFNVPPTMIQDLSRSTFSNTEQQDLHFSKHTLSPWTEKIEQELNLKLFGARSSRFASFNMDGLLRGDFTTRMEGHARAIQVGVSTPNEARRLENRPPVEGGDAPFMQSATVPISALPGNQGDADVESE